MALASHRRRNDRKQGGMSLLETISVVAIMGSLSATALPHFSDLPADARKSVVMGLEGAVQSASTLMHVTCATQAACALDAGASQVVLPAATVAMARGYPTGGVPQGIESTMQLSGFTVAHAGGTTIFQKTGAPRADGCSVSYESPAVDGGMPRITTRMDGC
jgi:MSHA pilin protein MshA